MRGVGATGIGEEFASRYPTSLDVLNRFLFNFVEKSIRTDVASPWIEQRFRRMLDTTPKERPFFALVNFNDAHEPYLPDFTHESSLHTWLSELRVSQQMSLVTAGRRIVSSREQAILHEMYVRSIRRTEERVLTLLNLLADADRWDNTLVIITSDHGQEFYEQGHLFHGFVVSDPVARIPLLVHFPSWMKVHVDSDQWTSLVDVHATIYDLLGIDQSADQVGVSLARLSGKSRDRAVYCVSDGLLRPSFARKWTNPRRIDALDRVRVAAYRGTKKLVVVERTGAGMVYDTLSGKSENFDPVQNADLELADTYDRAEFALDAMSSRSAGTSGADEVVQRLEGWGYT
jgi:arylsulfatase A-like enzyme